MNDYLFDVKLFAAFRVNANSVNEARAILRAALDCATITAGDLTGEASEDGEADLIEINGEAPDDATGGA